MISNIPPGSLREFYFHKIDHVVQMKFMKNEGRQSSEPN